MWSEERGRKDDEIALPEMFHVRFSQLLYPKVRVVARVFESQLLSLFVKTFCVVERGELWYRMVDEDGVEV